MNLLPKCRLLSALSLLLALLTVAGMPAAVAQEGQSSASASQQEEEIARLNELLDQARAERIDTAVEANKTGTHGAGKRTDTARSDGVRYCAILP
jgi:Tfp pilus assembly protein PilV